MKHTYLSNILFFFLSSLLGQNDMQKGFTFLENDSTSFDGNLGNANALFAADRIIPAYTSAYNTLKFHKNQKDALGFIEKLNIMHTPFIEEHVAYTFDNGDNIAFSSNTTVSIPFSTRFLTTLSYQFRTTQNTVSLNEAISHVLIGGLEYKLFPKTKRSFWFKQFTLYDRSLYATCFGFEITTTAI